MNKVISLLRNLRIYQITVVCLVGFMFLLGQAFSYTNVAQADVKTPEGIYYKGTPDSVGDTRNDSQIKNAQNKLRDAAENVREKLNLDEETPRATKEFFNSDKNTAKDREGYYQNPPSKQLKD